MQLCFLSDELNFAMEDNNIVIKAQERATTILQNDISSDLTYHNYEHTKMVVDAVELIAKSEQLSPDDKDTVVIAAWFHDTGFRDAYDGHEAKSVEIATEFLKSLDAPSEKIKAVENCIKVTALGSIPQNKLEEVIKDADISHVSSNDYQDFSCRLREEWLNVMDKRYNDLEWWEMSLDFVTKVRFYTNYGQEVLCASQEKVKAKLEKKVKKVKKNIDAAMMEQLGVNADELKAMKKKLQKAEGKPDRGIETMFRLTSKNHITLSTMADSKANILISVNSIIISIIIGALMQKLDNNPHLIIPTIILLSVNLGSIVFSILSIRPNVTKGLFTRMDIEDHKTNLLFFGNFHKMNREDYHWGMNRLMENKSFLYSSLIDDIYFLGVVLAKKYRLLRTAYNIFMFGIVIAVVSFAVSNVFAETRF